MNQIIRVLSFTHSDLSALNQTDRPANWRAGEGYELATAAMEDYSFRRLKAGGKKLRLAIWYYDLGPKNGSARTEPCLDDVVRAYLGQLDPYYLTVSLRIRDDESAVVVVETE
ncbi:hypothetical protein Q3G72_017569 [Acer saccharum]|nr:hypothetical protein Q3G72_017569 [Acer saccharum]